MRLKITRFSEQKNSRCRRRKVAGREPFLFLRLQDQGFRMPEVVHAPKASREQVSPEPDVEDNLLFLETMNIIHEVFVPRGIEANPSITAALAYFLTRRGETSLDTGDASDTRPSVIENRWGEAGAEFARCSGYAVHLIRPF